jgi:hypothetical protein
MKDTHRVEMDLELPRDFEEEDALQVLDRARPVLDLPPDAVLRVENVTRNTRGTRIDFAYTVAVELDDDDLRAVAGIRVDVSAHGQLKFNTRGNLVSHQIEPADPRQLRAITDHLSKLVANGQVYIAEPGEQIDPDRLRRQGKDWYVQQDAQGKKHLKRAWIS